MVGAEEFTAALAKSEPEDVIVLDAGKTGNFAVPAKANSDAKWIYIVSSKLASLPEGKRVLPGDVANMSKIVTPRATGVLAFADSSNHIRLVGIEIASASTDRPPNYTAGVYYGYALVGTKTYPPVKLPDSIISTAAIFTGMRPTTCRKGYRGTSPM